MCRIHVDENARGELVDACWPGPGVVCGQAGSLVPPTLDLAESPGGGYPGAGSARRREKAVMSASVHGQRVGRWSLSRRPERVIRPATCNSR